MPFIYFVYKEFCIIGQFFYLLYYYRELCKFYRSVTQIYDKNKIVHIYQPSFFDHKGKKYLSGGAERYLSDLGKIIIDLSYIPIIIQTADRFWHNKHDGIDIIGLPACNNYVLFRLFIKILNKKTCLSIFSPFSLASNITAKQNTIGISHGIFWDNAYGNQLFSELKSSLKRVDSFVSVDTATISWFRSTFYTLAASKDFQYIPNYADLDIFVPKIKKDIEDKIIITYPRRLYAQRGYFLVESVVGDLLDIYPNIEFHFVGQSNPESIDSITDLVKKHNGRVLFYQQDANEMHLVYQKSDIVLIPTVASEGTSLSCIEAMACSNAIIATNVGGLPDLIINEYNGLLINPNINSLRQALILLIENQNLRTVLGANAYDMSKVFSKKKWSDSWISVLNKHLKNN